MKTTMSFKNVVENYTRPHSYIEHINYMFIQVYKNVIFVGQYFQIKVVYLITNTKSIITRIEVLHVKNVIEYLIDIGKYFDHKINRLINDIGLNITMGGILTLPSMLIKENDPLVIKTYITQEMLKKGYLASNITYLSFKHTKERIDDYLEILVKILSDIKTEMNRGNDLKAK